MFAQFNLDLNPNAKLERRLNQIITNNPQAKNHLNYRAMFKYMDKFENQSYAIYQKSESLFELGLKYEEGVHVKQSLSKAIELYSQSAELKYDIAQFKLGYCFELGKGVSQDYKLAFYYYDLAAQQGFMNAQNNIAVLYENG